MKVLATNSPDGQFVLRLARTNDAEVVPMPSILNLDLVLHTVDSDLVAVAAAILFRSRLEKAKVELPEISQFCADGLNDYFGSGVPSFQVSADVFPSNPSGQNTLIFPATLPSEEFVPQPAGMGRSITVHILDGNRWTGRLFTMDKLLVGSNLDWVSQRLGLPDYLTKVAFGVLISGEWNARRLLVEISKDPPVDKTMEAIQRLTSSIGIELRFSTNVATYGKSGDDK